MLEKGKISGYQLYCLAVLFLVGNTTIIQTLTVAGRDSWLATLLGVIGGLIIAGIVSGLAKKFPSTTLIEYLQVLLGTGIGKVIALGYLGYFFYVGALALRSLGELMTSIVMPETPLWFFHLSLALVAAMFASYGVEVMGRASEIAFPVALVMIITSFILLGLSGIVDLKNLLPLLEGGLAKVLKGAVPIVAFPYGEMVLLAMILPYLNIAAQAARRAGAAILTAGSFCLICIVLGTGIYGEFMASLTFPRLAEFKLISVGGVIERIDMIMLGIWIGAVVVKAGLVIFALALGLAQFLGLRKYQPLLLPVALLMAVFSNVIFGNTLEMLDFSVNTYPVFALPFQVVLPLLMLAVAKVKAGLPPSRE